MRWEKKHEEPGPTVVRALSFSVRGEDGSVLETPAAERRRPTRGQTSFTSIDVKKSRRVARLPQKGLSSTMPRPHISPDSSPIDRSTSPKQEYPVQSTKPARPKSERKVSECSLHRNSPPSIQNVITPSSTLPNQQSRKIPRHTSTPLERINQPLGTQSLERPSRVNKLVLRVPSAASEYQHRRVIHSVCVPAVEGGQVKSEAAHTLHSSQATQADLLSEVPAIFCETSTRLLPETPKTRVNRLQTFTPGQVISSISLGTADCRGDDNEKWRNGGHNTLMPGGVSDAGSSSLSNFSSGDGLSTFSHLSHHLSYFSMGDGLSTPTHMGSTTRLVHTSKATTQERCSRCWKGENVTTALSILSLAATLGNFLRLPRMVYFHGGGTFLTIYILLTLVFGIPLTFLEIGLGQFSEQGAVKLWRAVNLFRGVGYAKALLSFALAVSYSTEIASALALMAYSLNGPLPFAECDVLPAVSDNGSSMASIPFSQDKREQCLVETVLASSIEQPMWFGIQFAFLLVIWVAVLICVMKRTVTYRRCMYFIFPGFFALIAALLVQNSSNNSSQSAINKLFSFQWTALGDVQVWYFAMVQMFFSLQIGFGNIGTCSGRIFPKTNAFWTAMCLVISNLAMGIASVVLVYLWLGSLNALNLNLNFPVPEAFVLSLIYQVSTSTSVIWACLAYILVFLAGLSSLITCVYTVLVVAAFETKRRWRWRHLNGFTCLTACLLGALCIIPGKLSMAHVIEHYLVSHGVIALTILELIGFAVIYGCSNLYNDFEFVIGSKLSSVWRSLWLVTPCVLIVVEICGFCLLPLDRENEIKDSEWQTDFGWALYGIVWLVVLFCAIYQVYIQVDYNIAQKFVSALKPSRNWGPVDPIYRHCWVQWRNRYLATGARDFTLKRRGTRDYTHHARNSTPAKIDCSTDSLQWPRSRH